MAQNISLPLHILWRLDTLLLNLGLTLVLSAFYFNAVPTYRHDNEDRVYISAESEAESGRYLWLVWTLVAVLHIITSSMWKLVERVGIGAVIWGVSRFHRKLGGRPDINRD